MLLGKKKSILDLDFRPPWMTFIDVEDDDASGGGGGGGGQPPKKPAAAQDLPPEPGKETFTREYVTELRQENKGWRLKADEERKKRETAEADAAKARKEAEDAKAAADTEAQTKAEAAEKAANDRVIRAELRTIALKAGMIDLDGLKLADLSKVTLEGDEVKGADELIAALKEAKPYLFGEAARGTSDTKKPPPKPGDEKPKKASEMTQEEYEAAKKAALK